MSITEDVTATLRAQMGGHPPVIVVGADLYNQTITGDVSMTIRNKAVDSEHIPVVVIADEDDCDRHVESGRH